MSRQRCWSRMRTRPSVRGRPTVWRRLTRLGAIEQKMDRVLEKLENAVSKEKEESMGTLSYPESEVDELESSDDEAESKPKRKRTSSQPLCRS